MPERDGSEAEASRGIALGRAHTLIARVRGRRALVFTIHTGTIKDLRCLVGGLWILRGTIRDALRIIAIGDTAEPALAIRVALAGRTTAVLEHALAARDLRATTALPHAAALAHAPALAHTIAGVDAGTGLRVKVALCGSCELHAISIYQAIAQTLASL